MRELFSRGSVFLLVSGFETLTSVVSMRWKLNVILNRSSRQKERQNERKKAWEESKKRISLEEIENWLGKGIWSDTVKENWRLESNSEREKRS